MPLHFAPGQGFLYSLAIDVVGAAIEAVTGLALPEAIGRLVTGPLGLHDTGFAVADRARLTTAYADDTPAPRRMHEPDALPFLPGLAAIMLDPARALDDGAFPSGGAGMAGTAADILRLLETLRQGGAPLIPATLVAEMGRDQIPAIEIESMPGWGYGLGFAVLRDARAAGVTETVGSWRWGGAYGHSWFVDPVRKLSVVALTNTALEGMAGGRFPADLSRAIYAAL